MIFSFFSLIQKNQFTTVPIKPLSLFLLLLALCLQSCASHPVVNPHLPEAGKTKRGYAVSLENVAPFLWYRVGISDKSELGLRLGLPIYGSGIDYSRLLYKKNNKWNNYRQLIFCCPPNSFFFYPPYKRFYSYYLNFTPISFATFYIN